MSRVNVYAKADGHGHEKPALLGHFDWAKADRWSDADGNGNGSGGAGHGEAVMLTAGGKWVLESWTRWRGRENRYEYITADEARDWLLRNHEDKAVAEHFGEIPEEDDRRGGRPEIGGAVHVRFGEDLLVMVDEYAAERRISRAEAIRRLTTDAVTRARVARN